MKTFSNRVIGRPSELDFTRRVRKAYVAREVIHDPARSVCTDRRHSLKRNMPPSRIESRRPTGIARRRSFVFGTFDQSGGNQPWNSQAYIAARMAGHD